MRVVYKYPLYLYENVIPEGDVLAVDFQSSVLHAWIEHTKDTIHRMKLYTVPTGVEFDDLEYKNHVGSAVSDDFVLHVYRK